MTNTRMPEETVRREAAAAAAERRRLLGEPDTDDESSLGVLDRFTVGIITTPDGHRMVYSRCNNGCGDRGAGTVQLIARDLDGDQSGLTIAELAWSALAHWDDDHAAVG